MREILMMVAAALIGTGGVARAQVEPLAPTQPMAQPPAPPVTPAPPKGFHEHDGFFLQMELTGGGLSNKYTSQGNRYELSGAAAGFSVAVGGALLPNFILAGHLWFVSVTSPTVKENGQSFGTPGDTSLDLNGMGVNLTYYLMPSNFYLSVTPAIGVMSLVDGGVTYDTKEGFAIRVAVGKEWWVSDNWGLGLNLQYAHAWNESGTGVEMSTDWAGLAFSATYN